MSSMPFSKTLNYFTENSSSDKKRTYNSMQSIDVSVEDMEAYRILKVQREDPMAALLNSEELLEYKK